MSKNAMKSDYKKCNTFTVNSDIKRKMPLIMKHKNSRCFLQQFCILNKLTSQNT